MARSTLEVTIMAAEELKNVSTFGKMNLYAVAWIDPSMKRATRVLHKAGRNPVWNDSVSLSVEHYMVYNPNSRLTVQILSESSMGDKVVGSVSIAVSEVFIVAAGVSDPTIVTLHLLRPSGRPQGIVRLSMKLIGDVVPTGFTAETQAVDKSGLVMGIPVEGAFPVRDLSAPYLPSAPVYGGVADEFFPSNSRATVVPAQNTLNASTSSGGGLGSNSRPYSDPIPYAYPPPLYPGQQMPPNPYYYMQDARPRRSSNGGGGLLLGLLGGALGGLLLGDILS